MPNYGKKTVLKGHRHEIIYPFWSKHSDLATQKQAKIGLMNCFHFRDNTVFNYNARFLRIIREIKN